jgi:hypothetical protein
MGGIALIGVALIGLAPKTVERQRQEETERLPSPIVQAVSCESFRTHLGSLNLEEYTCKI